MSGQCITQKCRPRASTSSFFPKRQMLPLGTGKCHSEQEFGVPQHGDRAGDRHTQASLSPVCSWLLIQRFMPRHPVPGVWMVVGSLGASSWDPCSTLMSPKPAATEGPRLVEWAQLWGSGRGAGGSSVLPGVTPYLILPAVGVGSSNSSPSPAGVSAL